MSVSIPQLVRNASNNFKEFVNRNPRNLERMQIARKPAGYHLEKPGRRFWHNITKCGTQEESESEVSTSSGVSALKKSRPGYESMQQHKLNFKTPPIQSLGEILARLAAKDGFTINGITKSEFIRDSLSSKGYKLPILELTVSSRTVTAQVVHFLNGPVIEAKTSEWALRKQLYSIKDTSAYINLGRVLGQRCLESGISEMYCNIQPIEGGKIEKFLAEVVNSGVKLEEPDTYKKPNPWDQHRPEKPWEVTDE
ncbi:39S ribosomal protein L18, mitochondrial [Eumeta japonica]|uniref:39S ribosomal protein L18, mitochondrial n=1 Tax=Eumeta variegata TaxID=151549 RepID=A0A4C1Y6E4_EUMVA|nr:39S ribosomal protein L18, mitochondrial [Eumeta japonica]